MGGGAGTLQRVLGAGGCLLAAAAIGASAYAAHAAEPGTQARLWQAALFAFGNGVAMAMLSAFALRRAGLLGMALLGFGTVLFSGSLAAAALAAMPATLAPFGGIAMIGGWCVLAVDRLRG